MATTTEERDVLDELADKTLDVVSKAEDLVVETTKSALDQVGDLIGQVSYPEALPRPSEIAERVFDFAGDVLDQQREFVSRLIGTVEEHVPPASEATSPAKAKAASKSKPRTPAASAS